MKFLRLLCIGLFIWVGFVLNSQAQDPIKPPPQLEEPSPHENLKDLKDQLTKVASSLLLNPALEKELQRPLDKTLSSLGIALPQKAVQAIEVFKNKAQAQLPPEPGSDLIELATDIQEDLLAMVLEQRFAKTDLSCELPTSADYTTIEVGGDSPDGFTTIKDALNHAAKVGFDAVELMVAGGRYREGLITITRHTRVIGEEEEEVRLDGSFLNTGPYLLAIDSISIGRSLGGGAVVVDDPCATTMLQNVTISGARGYGIWQQGGFLSAHKLGVDRTAAIPGSQDSGVAIFLSGGVDACLGNILLAYNDGGAVFATGNDTRVFAGLMSVVGTEVNPMMVDDIFNSSVIVPGPAALEVDDGALLLGQFIDLRNSQYLGLYVHHGGQAHLRYSNVNRTQRVTRHGAKKGGLNVAVQEAALELTSFTLSHGDLVGLFVSDATVSANDGLVGYNTIGWFLSPNDVNGDGMIDGEDAGCILECLGDTRFLKNDRVFDGPFSPVPPLPGDICVCTSVPFSVLWCE